MFLSQYFDPLIIDLLKVCSDSLVDSVPLSFRCCPRIKVLHCLTDGHVNDDFDGQEKNETDQGSRFTIMFDG